ncbi:MAG: hypothetical protein LBK01_09265, partial [Burkholderiaceae bacterium]|nr:hypothetical protein [Burkholderiaceae bacterium]
MKSGVALLFIVLLFLSGCQTPVPPNFSVRGLGTGGKKIDAELRTVTVTIDPHMDRRSVPAWWGWVDVAVLWREALQEALDQKSVFTDGARKTVSIQVNVSEMRGSLDMGVVTATYRIIDRATGNTVYGQVIASHARNANDAVRKNILQFLDQLDLLDINKFLFLPNQ